MRFYARIKQIFLLTALVQPDNCLAQAGGARSLGTGRASVRPAPQKACCPPRSRRNRVREQGTIPASSQQLQSKDKRPRHLNSIAEKVEGLVPELFSSIRGNPPASSSPTATSKKSFVSLPRPPSYSPPLSAFLRALRAADGKTGEPLVVQREFRGQAPKGARNCIFRRLHIESSRAKTDTAGARATELPRAAACAGSRTLKLPLASCQPVPSASANPSASVGPEHGESRYPHTTQLLYIVIRL